MIKADTHAHLDQFGIIQNLQTSPIPQSSFLAWTFFAAFYSKIALELLWRLLKSRDFSLRIFKSAWIF